MPNIQLKSFNPPKFPIILEEVSYKYLAQNDREEKLIFANYKNEDFFLKVLNKSSCVLLKADKLAKPSMVSYIQHALNAISKNDEILWTNCNSSSKRLQKRNELLKDIDFFANDFTDFAKNFSSCNIEIGFGSGRHLLFQAKEKPNELFIGIEIHKPSIEQLSKQCKLQNIKNIIIINFDARILVQFIPSNFISRIFVHFPVPWDKKPNRRVINEDFLSEAIRVLKAKGTLELRTDSEEFFRYSLECMLKIAKTSLKIDKNKDLAISSKYEDRWKKMKKDIFDLTFTNHEISNDRQIPSKLVFEDEIKHMIKSRQTLVFEDYFVHFEEVFMINEQDFILKLSFGDSNSQNHCYIIVEDKKARYFPNNIYSTKSNKKAHEQILNIFQGK